jgi:hypothetical protein
LSFEGWGVSVQPSFESLKNSKLSRKSVSAAVCTQFISDKLTRINPMASVCEVTFSGDAEEMLKQEGPVAFHTMYGSHFVCGLTKGEIDERVQVSPASTKCIDDIHCHLIESLFTMELIRLSTIFCVICTTARVFIHWAIRDGF